VVVITGGGAFCAGGDLGALGKAGQTGAKHELEAAGAGMNSSQDAHYAPARDCRVMAPPRGRA